MNGHGTKIAVLSNCDEVARAIAQWEDAEYSYDLDPHGRRIQLCHEKTLDGLAQGAISEAVRLEAQEAPQRELEKNTRGRGAPRFGKGTVGEQVELPSVEHA